MPASAFSDLWSAAVDLYGWLIGAFGRPASFLARKELTRAERDAALAYLRPLERMLRRLVADLALTFVGPLRPPSPQRARRAARSAPRRWPGDESARWPGVRFNVLPRAQARAGRAARRSPPEIYPARPIAWRMEAVARIMAAPEPHARRLAYKLRTQTNARERAWRLAAAVPERSRDAHGADLVDASAALLAETLFAARLDTG